VPLRLSQLPIEGLSCNVTPRTLYACASHLVCLVAVGQISKALYLEDKPLFVRIPHFGRGIFQKLHAADSQRTMFTQCKFGYDRSIMKRSLLGEQSKFSSVSRLPIEGFS
jgi:hypothetical protein